MRDIYITQISFVDPAVPSTSLEDPTFHLTLEGARYQPGQDARAFLFTEGGEYLKALGQWDATFPGFEHEVEGAEVVDGVYNVLCIKA